MAARIIGIQYFQFDRDIFSQGQVKESSLKAIKANVTNIHIVRHSGEGVSR